MKLKLHRHSKAKLINYQTKSKIKTLCLNLKNFSLIELLITSLLTVIVLTGIVTYLTFSYEFNSKINYQTQSHNILTLAGREIEASVKKGTKIYFYNQNNSLLPDSAYTEIDIYTINSSGSEVFYRGYNLKTENGTTRLLRTDRLGNTIGEIIVFQETDFKESIFFKKPGNNSFLAFDLKVALLANKKTIFDSEKLYFYAKCRN